jgi:hypothetical protein
MRQLRIIVFFVSAIFINVQAMESGGSAASSDSTQNPQSKKFLNAAIRRHMSSLSSSSSEDTVDVREFEYMPSKEEEMISELALKNAPPKIKAVARKLGEKCYFVTSGDILLKYRNATSQRLKAIITAILRTSGKSVLVIDEINKLVENYTSENNDSGQTASTLWTSMDENQNNKNFYLIGTANDSKKMPPQLQDRFRHTFVTISSPTPDNRRQIIQHFLDHIGIPIDKQVNEYIDQIVERTKGASVRNIKNFFYAAKLFALVTENPVLTRECLEQAVLERTNDAQVFCDFLPVISDEERRHQESLKLQKESLALSKEQVKENRAAVRFNSLQQLHIATKNLRYAYPVRDYEGRAQSPEFDGADSRKMFIQLDLDYAEYFPINFDDLCPETQEFLRKVRQAAQQQASTPQTNTPPQNKTGGCNVM